MTLQSRCVVVAAVARLDRWKDSGGDQLDMGGGKEEETEAGKGESRLLE